jgi:hypothetical protein
MTTRELDTVMRRCLIEDGLYAARALEDFRAMVEHPIDAWPRTVDG